MLRADIFAISTSNEHISAYVLSQWSAVGSKDTSITHSNFLQIICNEKLYKVKYKSAQVK